MSDTPETGISLPEFDETKTYRNLPLIVVVGRPNVGKSTLFNRFLHKRRAITDPTPGVTRDPIEEPAFVDGKPVRLMDTGGFKLDRETGSDGAIMDNLVVEKTLGALKKADRILLLLEAGPATPEDEEFIELLRPYSDRLVVAVNKTEGGRREAESWNYLSYGFPELLFISAEHGDNISELAEVLTRTLDFSKVEEGEKETCIRVAIVGKPNTGKSTLANRLTGTNASIVSNIAGTTRDVVEGKFTWKGNQFHVLDTAGIRRKARINENIEYYSVNRAIKTLKHADIVFHMIDAQEGLAEQDKKIIAHAAAEGIGVIFVLNKWDTMDQDKKTFASVVKKQRILFGQMEYAPVCALSALEGSGIAELLKTAVRLYEQLSRRTETSALNLALNDWITASPPPQGRVNKFKLRYMVQTQTNPVKFLVFATRPESVTDSYVAYIRNRIREDLGYSEIPVVLEVKGSRRKWEQRER
ncbi:MAG TPA: ribosome biogenesis GTPase Der [Treponemataceae bacterium]|jgi:GTP-binding protein|nr:MAG: GTPase Der [Spirochaetes bacterium ADurb.Bin215]HOF85966.1 ribosome biogenesis GTPase Der [Treponemataceae bacterium]HOS35643.1 ribosome biogenesis GTPase Der [Treponemataceae bacterium]HOU38490.1 ribosome biogenesis GTPase Der [Treponemataceae bacterium]HPA09974.1 ribosome biogenesis GTPase Der [Treponemataceae bacterium]